MTVKLLRSFLIFSLAAWMSTGHADDKQDIDKVFHEWIAAVTSGTADQVVKLYAKDAVLAATLSKKLRTTEEARKEYFKWFTAFPQLKANVNESHIRIYGDTAVNTGVYTFSFLRDGKKVAVPSRYSFTYHRTAQGWMIVDHHSSRLPVEF